MQTVKISIEIKDKKTLEKKVQWIRLDSPTAAQLHEAKSLYHTLAVREGVRIHHIIKRIKALNKFKKVHNGRKN